MKRRNFIKGMMAAGGMAVLGSGLQVFSSSAAAAAGSKRKLLINIYLPGAPDSLNMVVPYVRKDIAGVKKSFHLKEYHRARTSFDGVTSHLRLPLNYIVPNDLGFSETKVGGYSYHPYADQVGATASQANDRTTTPISVYQDGAEELRLGLNANLSGMAAIYKNGHMVIAPAVQHPFANLDHFVDRYFIESGEQNRASTGYTGWVNRYLVGHASTSGVAAVCLDRNVTQALKGVFPVTSTGGNILSGLPYLGGDADSGRMSSAIANNYAALPSGNVNDEILKREVETLINADMALNTNYQLCALDSYKDKGCTYGDSWLKMAEQAGFLAKASLGETTDIQLSAIAMTFAPGWDTHSNQGAEQGAHANNLLALDAAVSSLYQMLNVDIVTSPGEKYIDNVCILIHSEFGRTQLQSGNGTDHGRAGAYYVIGGNVDGYSEEAGTGNVLTHGIKLGCKGSTNLKYHNVLTNRDADDYLDLSVNPDHNAEAEPVMSYVKPTLDPRDIFLGILTGFYGGTTAAMLPLLPGFNPAARVLRNTPHPYLSGVVHWAPENTETLDPANPEQTLRLFKPVV